MLTASRKIFFSIALAAVLLGSFLSPTNIFTPQAHAQTSGLTELFCDVLKAVNEIGGAAGIEVPPAKFLAEERVWYNQSVCQFYTKVFDASNANEIFGERYTYAQVGWIFNSMGAFLIHSVGSFIGDIGQDIVVIMYKSICPTCPNPPQWLLDKFAAAPSSPNLASSQPNLQRNGVMGLTLAYFDTYRPSFIHGTVPNLLNKFSLASPVEAQGYGYTSLAGTGPRTLQALWAAFRNMSYFLMVLLLVVSGFMIMFRVRMGQTAVTLQLMIPKIILTLIGITFSFAISGFVIDLVYLTTGFVFYLIQQAGTAPDQFITNAPQLLQDITGTWGFFRMWSYMQGSFGLVTMLLGFIIPLGFMVIPILMLIFMFKAWWAMLKSYAHLIIHIVTGPFQILLGLLPGQSMGFGQWLRNVIGYAAVFVIIPLVFVFIMILWEEGPLGLLADWDPVVPLVQNAPVQGLVIDNLPNLPLFSSAGGLGGAVLQAGLGLILLSLIPSIADKVPAAFKAASFGKGDITGDLQMAYLAAMGRRGSMAEGVGRAIPGMPTSGLDAMAMGIDRLARARSASRAGSSTAAGPGAAAQASTPTRTPQPGSGTNPSM